MRVGSRRIAIAAGALFFFSACQKKSDPEPAAPPKRSPLSISELPTDDPKIALDNLSSMISGAEKLLARTNQLPEMTKLVGGLLLRAQILSRASDYDRAGEIAERAVKDFPNQPTAYVLRARVRSALHRFAEARADLEEAEERGAAKNQLDELRARIGQATGHEKEALALLERSIGKDRDTWELGAIASAIGDTGDLAKAEETFVEAQHHLPGVSPFALAWLYFQQGLMWERAGKSDRATELFAAAVERLPQYAPAVSHLAAAYAATGKKDEAIALLEPLAEGSEDPEYAGQLAGLYAEKGRHEEAKRLEARASSRYDELMKKHPEAYADHAARFWLANGASPEKALAAAEKNLEARGTEDALELAIQAALAARDATKACALADRIGESKRLVPVAALAYDACGKADRARELRSR
jgi:tetratricopeptide (TPR) repeat protein